MEKRVFLPFEFIRLKACVVISFFFMENPLLHISGLSLKYSGKQILSDVSLSLYSGRILALIGPNGAGKSSTMRIMAGLVRPESGELTINGKRVKDFGVIRQQAGFFIEVPSFYNYLSATQNLRLLQNIRKKVTDANDLLAWVGLQDAGRKKVGKFSKGMKQRLGIAQALIGSPDILVLDEPFHGLDPEVKLFLMNRIRDLARKEGKAVLISSHQLADMEEIADDYLLLNKGQVYHAGKIQDDMENKQHVSFHFTELISDELLALFNGYQVVEREHDHLLVLLSNHESQKLISILASKGYPPYKVEHSRVLHEKYMEIAE